MLLTHKTPGEKRAELRKRLASGKLLRFPGAFSPVVSMLIERQRFEGVYISGAVLAADLGLPDVGLTTLTEVAQRGRLIARATELPALIDADTGFGEALNAARAVQEFEEMGLCGCHFEDQLNPKRCGHLEHKTLVPAPELAKKIRAATQTRRDSNFLIIARTDARESEGVSGAIERARAYIDAGADVIFPEALHDASEFEQFRKAIKVPLLANMTEFGRSNLLKVPQLADLGVNIVIYPVTLLRLALHAAKNGLNILQHEGTQESLLGSMQTRAELYEMLQYKEYARFDQQIYNFKL
jgi:methylisocitrate lyase